MLSNRFDIQFSRICQTDLKYIFELFIKRIGSQESFVLESGYTGLFLYASCKDNSITRYYLILFCIFLFFYITFNTDWKLKFKMVKGNKGASQKAML